MFFDHLFDVILISYCERQTQITLLYYRRCSSFYTLSFFSLFNEGDYFEKPGIMDDRFYAVFLQFK